MLRLLLQQAFALLEVPRLFAFMRVGALLQAAAWQELGWQY
jgi:hypothetical protein